MQGVDRKTNYWPDLCGEGCFQQSGSLKNTFSCCLLAASHLTSFWDSCIFELVVIFNSFLFFFCLNLFLSLQHLLRHPLTPLWEESEKAFFMLHFFKFCTRIAHLKCPATILQRPWPGLALKFPQKPGDHIAQSPQPLNTGWSFLHGQSPP